MPGIPSTDSSEDSGKTCEKQVEKITASTEIKSGNVSQNGKCFNECFELHLDRSADDICKNRLHFCHFLLLYHENQAHPFDMMVSFIQSFVCIDF